MMINGRIIVQRMGMWLAIFLPAHMHICLPAVLGYLFSNLPGTGPDEHHQDYHTGNTAYRMADGKGCRFELQGHIMSPGRYNDRA